MSDPSRTGATRRGPSSPMKTLPKQSRTIRRPQDTRALMRERARERWPMVLLSLVSILQALALETLWTELTGERELLLGGVDAVIVALQGGIVFLTVVIVWLFFAQLVMRFVWVPGLRDSIAPFALGLIEFLLAELLGAGSVGVWIAMLATAFAISHALVLSTFARAALEPENGEYFRGGPPDPVRRHGPMLGSVAVLLVLAGIVELVGGPWVEAWALGFVMLLMCAQLWLQRWYWHRSISG